MDSSEICQNDSTNLPTASHSRGTPKPNAVPHKITSQEEVYETIGGSKLEASQNFESGKFSSGKCV